MGPSRDSFRRRLRFPRQLARLAIADSLENRKHARGDRRLLVVRHPRVWPSFYDVLLHWLALHHPEARAAFELHPLPCLVKDWSRYGAHVPWLQDPVEDWSPSTYRRASRLAARCDARGIPVVNRVDRLSSAAKATGAERVRGAGFRAPACARIRDAAEFRDTRLGLPLPLLVREDRGHGGEMLRAETEDEVRRLPLERFERPVAMEWVDVRSASDGLCRKYRYVVAGDVGVRQTMHVSAHWCVRGASSVFTEALRDEEVDYARRPEPEHARFVAAREALGLDFVAFDYSYDRDGRAVVWEANPYPFLHFVAGRRAYRDAPTSRVLAAMTRLYLSRAGREVSAALEDAVAG